MLLYGPNGERVILFDLCMNIIINSLFLLVSLGMTIMGHQFYFYPLIMFLVSIIVCHLTDTMVKIYSVVARPLHQTIGITKCLSLLSFLLWYIGSYLVVMNLIILYVVAYVLVAALLSLFYMFTLAIYIASISNLMHNHFLPPLRY